MKRAIAIDGPNGAGKSTIARSVADRLGFAYVDTGAFYRAVGLFCVKIGANLDNADEIEACLPHVSLSVEYVNSRQMTYINGMNMTADIRTQAAAEAASKSARVPSLREKVVELSRSISKDENVVMDGRDIGTVVLPDADLKIYLDAGLETRTCRRLSELRDSGQSAEYEAVLQEIIERDHRDSTRASSPLRVAEGAVVIDSSDMSVEQVCDIIVKELEMAKGRQL
ncbi:MAG: (d)CMP kinase [Defluviitaleaceae bacterium]|nr:(d)CMP kinase [Defluviitaleaceae bacterium]